MYDVVILTENRYINPKSTDWYIDQVIIEDKLLLDELSNNNLKVCKKSWDDPNFDWNNAKHSIFRTTWDYFDRFDEFFNWIEKTKNKTNFINSYKIIKWNIDKYYLKELSEKGINVAPTIFIEKGKKTTLLQLFEQTKWGNIVLKPTISGAGRHTYKINIKNHTKYEEIFQKLISKESMIFQEYLKNITKHGEISLIMIGGEYTHAVKKLAKKGDFRVQDDHGGTVEKYIAKESEISFAKQCLDKCPFNPIYARVDIVYDNNNLASLSELELIEPELWFRNCKKSVEKLSTYISENLIF